MRKFIEVKDNPSRHMAVQSRTKPGHRSVTIPILGLLVLFLLAGLSTAASIPDGMVAYWKFDDIGGGTVGDLVGSHPGICAGPCPGFTPGKIGSAAVFDGQTTSLDVDAHTDFDWSASDSFSIEYWVRTPSAGTVQGNMVIIGRDDPNSNLHWWSGIWPDGKAAFVLLDADDDVIDPGKLLKGTTSINDGKWHHIVAIRDADTGNNFLYVDGREEAVFQTIYNAGFESSSSGLNIGWLNLDAGYRFEGTLDELAVYNRVLTGKEIRNHYYLALDYTLSRRQVVKIMPLGDSLTYDNHSGDTRPPGLRTAYRQPLWLMLKDAQYNVDFVGSRSAGFDAEPAFDPDNEGYPGWSDDEIADIIYELLVDNPADVILLHIGTNYLDESPDDVENILNEIDLFEEESNRDVTVILARIINRMDHVCPGTSITTTFNDNVEAMALQRIQNMGDRIIIADMECGAALDYHEQPVGDMYDLYHPNDGGYAKMAAVWMDTLDDFLLECEPGSSIVSVPPPFGYIDLPYEYDVDAIGCPNPIYSLMPGFPQGMVIDEDSGKIVWYPMETGSFEVAVVATNPIGDDGYQIFSISVNRLPPCPLDMVHYWMFEDPIAPPFEDVIGDSDAGCTLCPSMDAGIVGDGVTFDGLSDGLNVAADGSVDWQPEESFSIEYWVKTHASSYAQGNEVVIGRDDPNSHLHWWTGIWDGGLAAFVLRDQDDDVFDPSKSLEGTTDITDGAWHHVVAVRDGDTNTNILYVDGQVEDAVQPVYNVGFNSVSAALNIGWLDLGSYYRFEGTLDELAIYNRALSQSLIHQHYLDGFIQKGFCNFICAGDFNSDLTVDSIDLAEFTIDFGDNGEHTATIVGDFDGDGDVDATDLVGFIEDYGRTDCLP